MTAYNILIVDGDENFRSAMVNQFSQFVEFDTLEANTPAECHQIADTKHIDLCMISNEFPGAGGTEITRNLRECGYNAPVILLTGQTGVTESPSDLDSNTIDWIEKPFKFSKLIARVRTLLHQFEMTEEANFSIGNFVFKFSNNTLVDNSGNEVRLTEKEAEILKFLYRAGEKPIMHEELLHKVWGYKSGITTRTLETHIYRLRQKIERDPNNATLLVTVDGGYMLVP